MFKASVDGFGAAAWSVGVVEVGQDVPGSAYECPSQCDEFGQAPRHARGGQCVDFALHQGLAADFVGIAVGVDTVLVDAPCDLEGDVAITGEPVENLVLLVRCVQA